MVVSEVVAEVLAAAHEPVELGEHVFFRPNETFARVLRDVALARLVVDVGAGMGAASKVLAEAGFAVLAIDNNWRRNEVFPIQRADAVLFPYPAGAVVLLARPCHGTFVESVVTRAVAYGAHAVVYVGLPKNRREDLGIHARHFRLAARNVGGDKEWMWVAYPRRSS